ncbi:MAG TPA: NHL repeat-containing protein [Acidimicrobiia bacterium]|nr:NHL repeat-containing protein [Acidimicrobiia bacterium]
MPTTPRRLAAVAVAAGLLAGSVALPATGDPGTVSTVAGVSPAGFSGDGGPATQAQMHEPRMVAFDPSGNMYVADTFNQVIRKVDTSGTISTVAGKFTGFVPRDEADCVPNFKGDGGPATEATLSCPHSVAADAAGNVFIADSANDVIRRVDPSGVITTIAGQGGVAGDAGDGGPATQAKIQGPKGIVFDRDGNLLIADSGNDKIKRLDLTAGVITTVAGTGLGGGNASEGRGDGGPATQAQMLEPRTVAVGPDGSLYIAEPKAHRVRRVDTSGIITTAAGTGRAAFSGDGGPAFKAALNLPRGIAVDGSGMLFIADSMNQRIRRVDNDGVITTVAGRGTPCYFSERNTCGDGGPALEAGFATPRAVEVGLNGELFVADTFNERIRRIEAFATPVVR